ncbi:MAG TPA: penicillin-binding transpeptidase domain-containing protein [Pyrinomonadaceae bacterium]|jgi:membrane peptidoglycan carboxypeptidase|nr:penicillin-binding transpeptidase domain-containing protein [Pyrinomonadaceae bacterium]
MKFSFTQSPFARLFFSLALITSLFVITTTAGPKTKAAAKKADTKKATAKRDDRKAKDSRKDSKRDRAKASAKKDDRKAKDDKRSSARDKRNSKNDRLNAKERAKADKADKNDKKLSKADRRAAEAERRRRDAERRAAIEAERRRREAAIREARERRLAFERGLKTQTSENISKDKTDGEDLRIRQAAVNALGSHAGSVVVMEAQTGKVLTIVNQDWAVRSTIRPCSTIKLVTGVAALNEGVVSKADGSIKGTPYRRNLDDALAFSDNGYFQRAGMQMGNQKLVEYGQKLGLGQPTGINLDGEAAGRLPYSNSNPRIYSHGDDTEVSTLQLAVLASEITNGGHRVLPRYPRNEVDNARFQTFYRANLDLPRENVRRVIPGMMGAAEYGTARRNMDQSLGVAGKTGSCIDKGSWVGLFASVAPIENPKYAVAVITRGERERGRAAAAVAADVYRALATGIVRTDRNLAQTEFRIAPKVVKPPVTAADDDDEDDAGATAADATSADAAGNVNDLNDLLLNNNQKVIVVPSAPKADKKLINRTGDSQPVNKPFQTAPAPKKDQKTAFPPVVITYDKSGAQQKAAPVQKP